MWHFDLCAFYTVYMSHGCGHERAEVDVCCAPVGLIFFKDSMPDFYLQKKINSLIVYNRTSHQKRSQPKSSSGAPALGRGYTSIDF